MLQEGVKQGMKSINSWILESLDKEDLSAVQ
jgi:hypothetical protein